MSMESTDLTCNACNLKGSDSVVWGRYIYQFNDVTVDVDRCLGWCAECNDFSPIEQINPVETHKNLHESIEDLLDLRARSNRLLFGKPSEDDIQYCQLSVNNNASLLTLYALREDPVKCLNCGSTEVTKFEANIEFDYENGMLSGEKSTGFIHPRCGGEFIATPSGMRIHLIMLVNVYDVNGNKVDQYEE